MFPRGGKPSMVAYMSIAQSKRWNRQPIKTGSSDHDDTVGGGVSLTAVSSIGDSSQVPSRPCISHDKDEVPVTPTSSLNANAKVFRPSAQAEALNEKAISEISSESSTGMMSSASQPTTTQQVLPAACEKEREGERGEGITAATTLLMNFLLDNQRTRSATTSTHEKSTNHKNHDRHGHGSSTTHSSPIGSVAQSYSDMAERQTAPITMNGVEPQRISDNQERPVVSSNQHRKKPELTGQAKSPMNNIVHHQQAQVHPQTVSTVNQSTHTLPVMNNKLPPSAVMNHHPIEDQQAGGVHYDAKAPSFTPATNMNLGFNNNMQMGPTKPSRNYQKQGFANGGAPAMENIQAFHPRQHQSGRLANDNPVTVNTMQVMPNPLSDNHQQHQAHDFLNGNIVNEQGQLQGYAHDHLGYTYNQPHPPTAYAINYQSPRGQVRESPMPYSNGHQNGFVYQEQDKQHAPVIHGYPPVLYPGAGNGTPNMSANGVSYQTSKTQDNSPSLAHGYAYGPPGGASGGFMPPYCPGGQPNHTSTALVHVDREPNENQPKIGPMNFQVPAAVTMASRSEMLQTLTENGKPSLQDLLDPRFLPFTETYRYAFPPEENGVIIIKNIPYETTRGEIIALLGKTSKVLNDRHEPIHIIMDRVTSKTQDAYCELSSLDAAVEMVERFKKGAENGRVGRIGNRVVEVELSSQTTLMTTLFPSSRYGVTWMGTRPHIVSGSGYPWENFRGFFTEEEMVMLSKHVENGQRAAYGRICPERPYECMISTLRKIPWYMAEYITIKQRHSVYESCMKMIETLSNRVNHRDPEDNTGAKRLTPQLLDRLVTSAMLCSGFSVVQKHNIATVAGLLDEKCREFNQPRFPESWRHQWTLAPKAGMPIDVLEWYIAVIRTETTRVVQSLDIHQRMPLQGMMEHLDGYWGFFWAEVNFPTGRAWDNMSLAECSRLEWQAIERIITRAIQGGNIPPSYTYGSFHINPASTNGPARLAYRAC
ncbi:hypothetical protein EKO27_g932 [Xylaria grammica]|uniref:Uncharacterized protein n=1 Tax=Xylaria grammica TaxID=363999 RepID=A0A439DIF7_9PEZI|nr:hypothetical protein EKO27_g932 [Xylaria grammica]